MALSDSLRQIFAVLILFGIVHGTCPLHNFLDTDGAFTTELADPYGAENEVAEDKSEHSEKGPQQFSPDRDEIHLEFLTARVFDTSGSDPIHGPDIVTPPPEPA